MDELRWFLLILGLVVILAVFLYGRVQDWRHDGPPWRRRRQETREPFADERMSDEELRGALDELDSLITEQNTEIRQPAREHGEPARHDARSGVGDASPEPPSRRESPATSSDDVSVPASPPPASPGPDESRETARRSRDAMSERLRKAFRPAGRSEEPEEGSAEETPPAVGESKIIVLTVMAPEGTVFAGDAVVAALEQSGLRYGEHRVYHRTVDTRNGSIALFSAANVVEPGWFDLDQIESTTTPGIALFLQLPGPFDGLSAFEQMLYVGRTVAEQLGGHLLDGRRCKLTQQSIEHLREELLEYRRRAHLAARKAR